jgi:hypothetical protein
MNHLQLFFLNQSIIKALQSIKKLKKSKYFCKLLKHFFIDEINLFEKQNFLFAIKYHSEVDKTDEIKLIYSMATRNLNYSQKKLFFF